MTVGRLDARERSKGVDEVLEALPALAVGLPDLAYMVVGDGTDRARLQAKARSLGVSDRVVFAGYVAEPEKPEYYRLADAYVMPCRGEGFGFVFLEAMATGLPVVASRADGSSEAVLGGELGLLVDPGSRDQLIEAVRQAVREPRGVVPAGLSLFSYSVFCERVSGILSAVLARHRAGRSTPK
jgi:glycosyltransferase involved in cell wall biosynthesis